MTLPSGSPTLQSAPSAPSAPSTQDVFRVVARQRLFDLAGDVADQLQSLPASEWEAPLWQLYERLQQAHARYFSALGGARMGAHRVNPQAAQEAVRDLVLWELLTLYRAGRE
jgi:hypothetical protein